jgi:microcompartment protein CcmL/EutN
VTCIGYRKVGSGLVSVCFEGEISAIHTAIERGVAVAALIDPQVKSLTIARPERSVVDALSTLKGRPPRAEAAAPLEAEAVAPAAAETREPTEPAAAPAPTEDKNAAMRKGKKA